MLDVEARGTKIRVHRASHTLCLTLKLSLSLSLSLSLRLGLGFGLLGLGCGGVSDLSKSEPCKSVGYAIASRTLDCTGDLALVNARYERFTKAHHCTASQKDEGEFVCAVSVNAARCEDVALYDENWDTWLLRVGECANILEHKDGSAIPRPTVGSDEITDNAVCQRAVDAAFLRRLICTPGQTPSLSELPGLKVAAYADVNVTHHCVARWPGGLPVPLAQADECVSDLEALDCSGVINVPYADILESTNACALIVEAR